MNKRAEAVNKANQWKEAREGDYLVRRDGWGNVIARTTLPKTQPQPSKVNSVPQKPQPQARPQATPQAPKARPQPQSQKNFNYGRPPAGLSSEAWTIYNLGKSERQKLRQDSDAQWRKTDEAARKSQAATNAAILKVQQGINETSRLNTKTTTEGGIKGQVISTEAIKYRADQDRLSSFEQTRGGIKQSEIQAGASNFAATTSADANKAVANTQAGASNYQSDRTLEGLNKQTDANYFLEREKNANQKEKNRQDLWLNAGLGILDSINKQRASSSQAAAQIYSSYLSSNPYNFKYWD